VTLTQFSMSVNCDFSHLSRAVVCACLTTDEFLACTTKSAFCIKHRGQSLQSGRLSDISLARASWISGLAKLPSTTLYDDVPVVSSSFPWQKLLTS